MSVTGRRNGAECGWSLAMWAAPAQLQQCWHILSAKSHFSSVDETKMNSVGPLVCLWGQSKLQKGWLDVLAYQYQKIKQDKQLFSFPRFYGMTVEESTSPSQGGPVLPQLAPLVLHRSHSQKSQLPFLPGIPPACPFRKPGDCEQGKRTGNGVASAVQSPGAGWNWWVSAAVLQRLGSSQNMGRMCWFSKEKSKCRLQQLARGRTPHCTVPFCRKAFLKSNGGK